MIIITSWIFEFIALLVIVANSVVLALGDNPLHCDTIDWKFLFTFTSLPIVGIFIGAWLTKFISGEKLKKGFGWFVLFMAAYMIYKELTR